ncbi:hypothetical protein SASPL_134896 [Salvia splendens]|uniref:Protein ENHANCED DISEASE RESISTANCE 2 C-terminal domain-containing protein n=1 Tax=Salvia splendens TaxID=180675 RepID=A0A8X8ZFA9_SALSN|nr:hypothetical protein SASPL_134896 [Salvia splendens]
MVACVSRPDNCVGCKSGSSRKKMSRKRRRFLKKRRLLIIFPIDHRKSFHLCLLIVPPIICLSMISSLSLSLSLCLCLMHARVARQVKRFIRSELENYYFSESTYLPSLLALTGSDEDFQSIPDDVPSLSGLEGPSSASFASPRDTSQVNCDVNVQHVSSLDHHEGSCNGSSARNSVSGSSRSSVHPSASDLKLKSVPFCPLGKRVSDSWSDVEPGTFRVRGVNYFGDKKKDSAPNCAAYYPFGLDVFFSQRKIHHIARFVELPSVNSYGKLPSMLVVIVQIPLYPATYFQGETDGEGINFVLYFKLSESFAMDLPTHVVENIR